MKFSIAKSTPRGFRWI